MKKILLSIATLALVSAGAIGGTAAIFSDSEVSTGNTFTAGAIDLTVDNESYYNGAFNEGTSWLQTNLDEDNLFFDFLDLKPGDWGEDTISLHVNNNDSYLCADVKLTSNTDNGSTEPENNDENPYTAGEGELADNVHFIWWADDGDNVFETNESLLPAGALGALNVGQTATVALADSNKNIWNEANAAGPLPGDSVRYIGKGWCFGDMTLDPESQDELGHTGTGIGDSTNGPLVRGAGFSCDGSEEDNSTQTDGLTADISFRAVQSRNNPNYLCNPPVEEEPETASLTIDKIVQFSSTIIEGVDVTDFQLHINGPGGDQILTDEQIKTGLTPGVYTVSEVYSDLPSNVTFNAVFTGSCTEIGNTNTATVTLNAGESLTCTMTNVISPVQLDQ